MLGSEPRHLQVLTVRWQLLNLAQRGHGHSLQPRPVRGPWAAEAEVAVLDAWFPLQPPARPARWDELDRPEPAAFEALAATPEGVRKLTRWVADGLIACPQLRYGMIALLTPHHPGLTELERDLVWRVLGVPVFQQYRDASGELIAFECEWRRGLHLSASFYPWRDAVIELLEFTPCPCGRPEPRLMVEEPTLDKWNALWRSNVRE